MEKKLNKSSIINIFEKYIEKNNVLKNLKIGSEYRYVLNDRIKEIVIENFDNRLGQWIPLKGMLEISASLNEEELEKIIVHELIHAISFTRREKESFTLGARKSKIEDGKLVHFAEGLNEGITETLAQDIMESPYYKENLLGKKVNTQSMIYVFQTSVVRQLIAIFGKNIVYNSLFNENTEETLNNINMKNPKALQDMIISLDELTFAHRRIYKFENAAENNKENIEFERQYILECMNEMDKIMLDEFVKPFKENYNFNTNKDILKYLHSMCDINQFSVENSECAKFAENELKEIISKYFNPLSNFNKAENLEINYIKLEVLKRLNGSSKDFSNCVSNIQIQKISENAITNSYFVKENQNKSSKATGVYICSKFMEDKLKSPYNIEEHNDVYSKLKTDDIYNLLKGKCNLMKSTIQLNENYIYVKEGIKEDVYFVDNKKISPISMKTSANENLFKFKERNYDFER